MSKSKSKSAKKSSAVRSERERTSLLGFWSAILVAISAAAALVIDATNCPAAIRAKLSGDGGNGGSGNPALIILSRMSPPMSRWNTSGWFPPFWSAFLFVVLTICFHHHSELDNKLFSQIALSFATLSRRGPRDQLFHPAGGRPAEPFARRIGQPVVVLAIQSAWNFHRAGGSGIFSDGNILPVPRFCVPAPQQA